ncbi:MAG: TonB family protein [Myxococcota bacterium]|jgi:TonB family protein
MSGRSPWRVGPSSMVRHIKTLLMLALGLLVLTPSTATAQLIPPKLVTFVQAKVPPDAPNLAATVVLWLTIDEIGDVTEVEIKQGAGGPWDAAAMAAARQFVFDPATEDGEAIAVRVPFTYRFRATARRGRFVPSRMGRRALQPTPGYRYSGTIVEKGSRNTLEGILVTAREPRQKQAQWEAFTDADGRYTLDGLPPGTVEISIITGEHTPVAKKVKGRPLVVGVRTPSMSTVYLDPVGLPEYITVVKDKKPAAAATEITLTDDELTKTPGTFGDPTRVVQSLPGVARSPFGLGYYVVRGASFANTGYFIDGHPALFLYHLAGGPGVIPPELVGQLSFYPGGYPVKYGRFATGAIVLTTKNPPDDRWHLDVSLDVFKGSILFSVPFNEGRGMVTASFRRSYYEALLPLIQEGVELSYLDYQLRVTYEFNPNLRAYFFSLGAEDAFSTDQDANDSGDATNVAVRLGFHRLVAGVDVDLTDDVTFKNSVAWEHDMNSAARTSEDTADISGEFAGWFMSIRSLIEYKPFDNLTLEMGLDSLITQIVVDLNVPSLPALGDPRPPEFDPIIYKARINGESYSLAGFVQADWEVIKGLRLIPGLRLNMDYYGDSAKWSFDPRMSVRYQVHPQWTLTAMGSMTHQPPAPFQYSDPVGDPDVPPTRGVQASLGVEFSPGDGWDIKVEGFYNHLYNMARPSSQLSNDDGSVARTFWVSDMQGRGYGLEVLVRKRFGGRFYGWLSYTLSRAERLRPPNEEFVLFEQDQTHILNLAISVLLGRDWSAGARFTLTSGNFFFPVTGSRYDADRDSYEPVYADREERLPFFHRLDVRIDKRFRFDTWMLEVYLDVQNVYNATNPESKRYSFDFRVQSEGVSVPILPTLGVRAVF